MIIRILDDQLYAVEVVEGFSAKLDGDAGIDLRARETKELRQGETTAIPLGVALSLDEDTVGWLTGRSSTVLAHGLLSHEGKIDSGYRGEIHGIVTALDRGLKISRGERICQLVVLPIVSPDRWVTLLVGDAGWSEETARGSMGLGSTGRI